MWKPVQRDATLRHDGDILGLSSLKTHFRNSLLHAEVDAHIADIYLRDLHGLPLIPECTGGVT